VEQTCHAFAMPTSYTKCAMTCSLSSGGSPVKDMLTPEIEAQSEVRILEGRRGPYILYRVRFKARATISAVSIRRFGTCMPKVVLGRQMISAIAQGSTIPFTHPRARKVSFKFISHVLGSTRGGEVIDQELRSNHTSILFHLTNMFSSSRPSQPSPSPSHSKDPHSIHPSPQSHH
jgi:hypothetical protein